MQGCGSLATLQASGAEVGSTVSTLPTQAQWLAWAHETLAPAAEMPAPAAEAPARDRLIDRLVLGAVADATLAAAE